MIAHLIESTLVLLLALAIAALPRLAARTRFAVVFAGLMKFAIPSAPIARWFAPMRIRSGNIVLQMIGRGAAAMPHRSPNFVLWIWIAIAVALFAAMCLRARRATTAALRHSAPASARQIEILATAQRAAGIGKRNIALRTSASVIAPAVIGLVRPLIIIPDALLLDDDELTSILAHECAHVARRDNLLGAIELLFGCALWFHPIVWLARRRLAHTRETACDEMVVARADRTIYLSALAKICRAAAAPRIATISCISSNSIQERMKNLMRFGTHRTLPHRLMILSTVALIAMLTLGAGILRATETPTKSPDKISMRLKDADLVDVIHTFEKLANVKIEVAEGVHGKVTVEVHDTPWEKALANMVHDAGYTLTREGDHYSVR